MPCGVSPIAFLSSCFTAKTCHFLRFFALPHSTFPHELMCRIYSIFWKVQISSHIQKGKKWGHLRGDIIIYHIMYFSVRNTHLLFFSCGKVGMWDFPYYLISSFASLSKIYHFLRFFIVLYHTSYAQSFSGRCRVVIG